MPEPKELVASAITRAQADLVEALSELEKIPAFDPGSVAFVAHALNNFLAVTGGTVELIVMHLGDGADPQVRVWLEGVRHATDLMARTVSQLVSASANSGAQLRLEKVDLPLLVQRACTYYQRVADRKSIRIAFDAASDVPAVWADRVVVAAVLDNLISNAIKFTPSGGSVTVDAGVNSAGSITIQVRDSGIGMRPEDIPLAFEPFGQVDNSLTRSQQGTGLGLPLVRRLVELHGGEVCLSSAPGQGTTVTLTFPPDRTLDPIQAEAASDNG